MLGGTRLSVQLEAQGAGLFGSGFEGLGLRVLGGGLRPEAFLLLTFQKARGGSQGWRSRATCSFRDRRDRGGSWLFRLALKTKTCVGSVQFRA